LVETIAGENQILWLLGREMQLRMSKTYDTWSLQMRLFWQITLIPKNTRIH